MLQLVVDLGDWNCVSWSWWKWSVCVCVCVAGGIWEDRFNDKQHHIKAKEETGTWSDEGTWSEVEAPKFL